MKRSSAFRQYIENMFFSLQAEIELNDIKMKLRNKGRILATLHKPKAIILDEISDFDKYELKAYQVVYHLTQHSEELNKRFDDLYVKDFIKKLLKKQHEEFRKLLVMIRQKEDIAVTIENNIDFTVPEAFKYITKNVVSQISLKGIHQPSKAKLNQELNQTMIPAAIAIFKTDNRGWGIKTLSFLKKGEKVTNNNLTYTRSLI